MDQFDNQCTRSTIVDSGDSGVSPFQEPDNCCLVQIYPTDVVDGLVHLDGLVTSIGRDLRCDLTINDASVSRQHARLEKTRQGYVITDLGSTNGTFVNDEPVVTRRLEGGDRIRFGSFIFKFLSADCIEAQYHETVYDAMTRDGLTSAFNKRYLLDNLELEIARSDRGNRPLSVMMLDIDHFKSINDSHGHLVGDEVLREFSRRIHTTIRSGDLFCRYGGEEFALVLAETSLAQAVDLAERCRETIAQTPFSSNGEALRVTVSIGIAQLSEPGVAANADAILEHADQHLYRAKQNGRNQVSWNRGMTR